jgi:asparagine synthetase B (glutamine-hydrolysing)
LPRDRPSANALPIGDAQLDIRAAVAWRTRTCDRGIGCYLSLYDDEIDERCDAFWSAWDPRVPAPGWHHLELTDAFVFASGTNVLVARGGASTFPLYWRRDRGRLRLSTVLPLLAGDAFSRSGLIAAAAAACLHSSYEPNGFTDTPLADWRRVRRSAVMRFEAGRPVQEDGIARPLATGQDVSRDAVARAVRAAFDAYGRSQRLVTGSALEVSGGFDSTLAAAIPSRAAMHGISVGFPYYEFRFERAVQQATAAALGISRVEIDGTELLPYAPPDEPVRFDEPSVFITGIRHAEQVARFAAACGANRLYMGHGGDQCYSTDLLEREHPAFTLQRGPFSRAAWRSVTRAAHHVDSPRWTDRQLGTFIYDARQDVWAKETYGVTIRTPFSDRRVFESALLWSSWCRARGRRPDKTILVDAAGDLLPSAVRHRKGKVAYDGVWMRAYHRHAEHLASVFDQARDLFAYLGISSSWLQQRVRDLAAWRDTSTREVLALYAIAMWLAAWGIERPGDITWAE